MALGIDVVGQEGGVDARIGGDLLLVERLDEVEGGVGRKTELLITLHLQGGEVEEARGRLAPFLLSDIGDGEGQVTDCVDELLALFLRFQSAARGAEDGIAIGGLELPILLGHEVRNLFVTADDEREGRSLDTSDGEYLTVLTVLEGVEACGIHAQQPVADGAAEAGFVETLVVGGFVEGVEALADGLLGERGYPETFDGACGSSLLHHPALDELALLSGIAAVDNHVGMLHEVLDDAELLADAVVVDKLDTEAGGHHRQGSQRPRFPLGKVVVRLLQSAKVTIGPGYLIPIAFDIAFVLGLGTQHVSNFARHTWLFSYADNHSWLFFRREGTKKFRIIGNECSKNDDDGRKCEGIGVPGISEAALEDEGGGRSDAAAWAMDMEEGGIEAGREDVNAGVGA